MIELIGGHRVAVRRAGRGGVPLLLIHGFPCTSLIWSHNMGSLVAAGSDVAALNLRGYGTRVEDDVYDLAVFSADLGELIDALGWFRVVVVTDDLGAALTMDFANCYAVRVGVVVLDGIVPDLAEPYVVAGRGS